MNYMPVNDSMFLLAESREHPCTSAGFDFSAHPPTRATTSWHSFADAVSLGTTAAGLVPASMKIIGTAIRDHNVTTPSEVPRTIFNAPIDGARRFVAQRHDGDRVSR